VRRQEELRVLDAARVAQDVAARAQLERLSLARAQFAERARVLEAEKAHWWSQRQRLRQAMEADLVSLHSALDKGQCSFALSGTNLRYQKWFSCFECDDMAGPKGFCEACSIHCHQREHKLRAHFSRFYCHCGWRQSVLDSSSGSIKSAPPNRLRNKRGGHAGCNVLHPPASATVPVPAPVPSFSSKDEDAPVVRLHLGEEQQQQQHQQPTSPSDPLGFSSSSDDRSRASDVITLDNLSTHASFRALGVSDQLKVLTSQCQARQCKWSDPDFPPSALALYIDPDRVGGGGGSSSSDRLKRKGWDSLVWRRASDHLSNPALFVPPFAPDVIKQGLLGDCYLMSALAVLTLKPDLLKSIFVTSEYSAYGIYAVRFFKNGIIRTVLIDDWLPCLAPDAAREALAVHALRTGRRSATDTSDGNKNGTAAADAENAHAFVSAFGRSLTPNELWVALVEKAYAKLHGSFSSIESGCVDVGLVDLTGGVGDRCDLTSPASQHAARSGALWSDLRSWYESGYLLGAGSPAGSDHSESASSKFGIVQGHAYSILRIEAVDGHQLLRLRNPWAYKAWTGAWSDGDTERWTQRMRNKLGFHLGGGAGSGSYDAGAFWISFEDFLASFDDVYCCRFFDRAHWVFHREIRGSWKGVSAGGCTNHYSVVHSPQYALTLHVPCDIVITLAQYDRRGESPAVAAGSGAGSSSPAERETKGKYEDEDASSVTGSQFAIGIEVYENGGGRVSRRRRGKIVASNPSSFAFRREVTAQFRLPLLAGDRAYTVLVATLEPKQETTYIMQVYATQPVTFTPLSAV
jgi:hypothetical protein